MALARASMVVSYYIKLFSTRTDDNRILMSPLLLVAETIIRLRKEINRLLSNVLNSIKEINRLRKEINRLLSKEMSNIYLKVSIETFSKLQFFWVEKICHQVGCWGLQLAQVSMKRSCCNLKIRCLGAKLCVAFLLF